MKNLIKYILIGLCFVSTGKAQNFNVILGRPSDVSITLSLLFDMEVNVAVEYGSESGKYQYTSDVFTTTIGIPLELTLSGLQSSTRYYYRVCYKKLNDVLFKRSDEYSFNTRREKGGSFTFTMESDPHPYDKKCYQPLWDICLNNQLSDKPDFMFDLGDTFGNDHIASTITSDQVKQLMLRLRPVFGEICHSVPFFFCQGNHEGENGYYLLQTPPNNIAVYETLWRKVYYPNPNPDGFYSGNIEVENFGMGNPENYYAFEWGDALFVVLDAYRYYTASAKPRGWDWTIGSSQYQWFRNVLESSDAKFKFVFTHHILGETRGAAAVAYQYEWGDSINLPVKRPGWGATIHQLMVRNKVDVFVQGHDHLFAVDNLDGVVYQTLPMPSDSSYSIGMNDNGSAFSGVKIKGSGHVRFHVTPDSVKVDFVSALLPKDETELNKNAEELYSYTIKKNITSGNSHPLVQRNSIYPNPTNGFLYIKNILNKPIDKVMVFTMEGKMLQVFDDSNLQSSSDVVIINLTKESKLLSDGIYLLSVLYADKSNVRYVFTFQK